MCDVTAPSVQAWRSLLEQYAAGIPVDFLLKWIAQESCGNACDTGNDEWGIFQLDADNRRAAGVTTAQLHTACSGKTPARPLTSAERAIQVQSGIAYIQTLRARAHKALADTPWNGETNPDFWKLVRAQHAIGGGRSVDYVPVAARLLGHAPQSWQEFADVILKYDTTHNLAHWYAVADENGRMVKSNMNLTPWTADAAQDPTRDPAQDSTATPTAASATQVQPKSRSIVTPLAKPASGWRTFLIATGTIGGVAGATLLAYHLVTSGPEPIAVTADRRFRRTR